ncbi:MAG: PAS domain-containing protein [Pirellulales bacterium]|nr:PAS domain-containing protein [Planctomycetales bacterium]
MKTADLAIFDEMPFFAWAKDADGTYLWVNKTLAGFADVDIVGKKDYELPWAADSGMLVADDQEVLITGNDLFRHEMVMNLANGRTVTLNVCKCLKELDGKRCTFGVSFAIDE